MSQNRKITFLGYIMRILNVFAVLALLLAYLSQYISPSSIWFPAFFGLAYPIILVVNILFVLWWTFRLRVFALVSLVVILLGYKLPQYYLKFSNNIEFSGEHDSFKVMTYNVHDFDYYSETYGSDNEAFDKITEFVKMENPDVVGFQEFYCHDFKPEKNTWVKLRAKAKYLFGYRERYNTRTERMFLTIMSKFPIIKKGIIKNAEGNKDITGIYADIKIKGKIIRFYNVHLNTIGISSETHFLTRSYDLAKEDDVQIAAQGAKRISSQFKKGFINRSVQAKQLQQHMENSPYPVILLGDFNDTPCSYSFTKISKGFTDSFVAAGKGLSNSFNGVYPSYRIDYILFDKHFTAYDYKRTKLEASDHYPISCQFILNEESDE